MMKTLTSAFSTIIFVFLLITLLLIPLLTHSQTITIGPNMYAFQYSGDPDYGLYFNATLGRYEFKDGMANPIWSVNALNGKYHSDICFAPGSDILIGSDRYAFRYAADEDYGLYFNATAGLYEFRDGSANPVLSINAVKGHVMTPGSLIGKNLMSVSNPNTGVNFNNNYVNLFADGKNMMTLSNPGTPNTITMYSDRVGMGDNPFLAGGDPILSISDDFSTDNIVKPILRIKRGVLNSAPGMDGIGASIDYYNKVSNSSFVLSTRISGLVEDASIAGGVDGAFKVETRNGDDASLKLAIYADSDQRVGIGYDNPTGKLHIKNYSDHNEYTLYVHTTYEGSHTNSPYGIYNIVDIPSDHTENVVSGFFDIMGGADGTHFGVVSNPQGGSSQWAFYGFGNSFASGGSWQASDQKLKGNINNLDGSLEKIMQINPKTYEFKVDKYPFMGLPKGNQIGLIAQELESIVPEAVMEIEQPVQPRDPNSEQFSFKGINYTVLIPVLIQGMKEQMTIIEDLQKEMESLKRMIYGNDEIEKSIKDDEHRLINYENNAGLGQNIPNPFTHSTKIPYYIPETAKSAVIRIHDVDGREISSYDIEKGYGDLEIQFPHEKYSGNFFYSLYVDDILISSKKMIVE